MVRSKSIGILLALLLFGATASAVFAHQLPSPPAQDGIPPGQMVRQGVSGNACC